MERITAVAKGQVQGVGYRHYISNCAQATGVHGYVKNLPDGTVEMVAESSPAALADFVPLSPCPRVPCRASRDTKKTRHSRDGSLRSRLPGS